MESDSISGSAASSMLPPATGSANINVGPAERVISTFLGAAATVYGIRNIGNMKGISMLLTGGMLLTRGISGYCNVNNLIGRNSNIITKKGSAMEVNESFTVQKPHSEVYAFWRKLENLPRFMTHLQEVTEEDHINSTWKAKVPGGIATVSWKAEIVEDVPGELIRWASKPGSMVDNAGEVKFKGISTNETEIEVNLTYRLPAGDVGSIAGKLFNPAVEKMMRYDLLEFRNLVELGRVPISDTADDTASDEESSTISSEQEYSKPKRTRVRKSPVSSSDEKSRDSGLQRSPSNDLSQPTNDPERSEWTNH
jgi:uncharacterized membrane protein